MNRAATRSWRVLVTTAAVAAVATAGGAFAATGTSDSVGATASPVVAKTHPMIMWNVANQWRHAAQGTAITAPAPPCPESGKLPSPFSNCGLPEFPAVGQPYPGNMSYWGGHVQVKPKVYLVLWGWDTPHAFSNSACVPSHLNEGAQRLTLRCDPQGVGKLMADFLSQMGGTKWAGVQTQYYEKLNGKTINITNPKNQLGGIWIDDSSHLDITKYKKSGSAVPVAVPGQSSDDGGRIFRQMALEAAKAVAHFHITDLANTNIVIAQPQHWSDPVAADLGYCAFHDYTQPVLENGWYNGIKPGISWTNMPYVYSQGTGCGANLVNSGSSGRTDGVTIALGHEVEETVTDPGAEDITPAGKTIGGWYDPFDANENGDKCAYVGEFTPGEPGSAGNIRGNRGGRFAVQSLWSNAAAGGAGYCAGAGTDLPF